MNEYNFYKYRVNLASFFAKRKTWIETIIIKLFFYASKHDTA